MSDRLNAGEALPDDPPPSRVIQQATRLKEVRTWVLACKPGSYLLLLVACMLPVPVSQAHAAATKSPATTRPVFLALQLSRELRQFSSQGLPSITSPRTARRICRWVASLGMGRLSDSAVPSRRPSRRLATCNHHRPLRDAGQLAAPLTLPTPLACVIM